jgi:hypothetical protein
VWEHPTQTLLSKTGLRSGWLLWLINVGGELSLRGQDRGRYQDYNFDETGFQIGQGKPQKGVTTRPNQASRGNPSKEMGELVSAIECITIDDFVLPPYFIFKSIIHIER